MKKMVYENKLNKGEELHDKIFDAARHINIEFQVSIAP
jgi:hypothetical protein